MRFYDSALIGMALWSNTVLARFLKYYIHLFPITSDIDIDNSHTLSLSSHYWLYPHIQKVQADDDADDTKKKTHQADIGVLRIKSTIDLSSQQAPLPFLCGEAVICVNVPQRCCVGDNACGHFTGKLCLSGGSPLCSGRSACWQANIPFLGGNGSCTGNEACLWANLEGSNSAWSVISSCTINIE